MACYLGLFLAGWFAGLLGEYALHWLMHRVPLLFHVHHHKEFFHAEPRTVAKNTIEIDMNLWFFFDLLAIGAPLGLAVGWAPLLLAWGGAFWHLVIVYEGCHALLHYDALLPKFVSRSRPFRWWQGCHLEHHRHSPAKNYCITCPAVDWVIGTYKRPPNLQFDTSARSV